MIFKDYKSRQHSCAPSHAGKRSFDYCEEGLRKRVMMLGDKLQFRAYAAVAPALHKAMRTG